MGAELTKAAKRQIVEEWSKKTGFARRDLNNVQILASFRMGMENEPEGTIPAGSQVAVVQVDIDEDLRSIDLEVSQVGSKRSTEIHLILDKPFGATLTDDQNSQLNAMWARLVSTEPVDAATPKNASEEGRNADNGAVLHVYRTHFTGFGGSVALRFNCDGLDIASLADSRYFTVDLEPGPHHCYFAVGRNNVDISLAAGQEHYLEIKISRLGGAKLRIVDQKEGLAAIQKLKYVDAKNIWDRWDVRPSSR